MMTCLFLAAILAACGPGPADIVTPPTAFSKLASGPMQPPTLTPTPSPTATGTPKAFSVEQLARWGEGTINRAAWSPDGRMIAIAHAAGIALLDGSTVAEITFWETASAAGELAFSPDGRRLAVGELDGRIEIYSIPTGSLQQSVPGGTDYADTLAFSPDGSQLLFSDTLAHVHLWSLSLNQAIEHVGC